MAIGKFKSSKSHFDVVTLGDSGVGKTLLATAICKVMNERHGLGKIVSYQDLKPEKIKNRGVVFNGRYVEYESPLYSYTHVDFDSLKDMVKAFISGAVTADIAIIVYRWNDVLYSKYIEYCHKFGIKNIVVFASFSNDNYDEKMAEYCKLDVRDTLEEYSYDYDTPIITGDSLAAYNYPNSEWGDSIIELLMEMENFPVPTKDTEKPALMQVENVLSVTERGAIVTGRVVAGTIKINDRVDVLGFGKRKESVVTGLEFFGQTVQTVMANDSAGAFLRGIDKSEIEKGMVITSPGSIELHTKFKALIYALSAEEGGSKGILNDSLRSCHLYNAETQANIELELDLLYSGDCCNATITLTCGQPVNPGTHFVVKQDSRTVAVGIVTSL